MPNPITYTPLLDKSLWTENLLSLPLCRYRDLTNHWETNYTTGNYLIHWYTDACLITNLCNYDMHETPIENDWDNLNYNGEKDDYLDKLISGSKELGGTTRKGLEFTLNYPHLLGLNISPHWTQYHYSFNPTWNMYHSYEILNMYYIYENKGVDVSSITYRGNTYNGYGNLPWITIGGATYSDSIWNNDFTYCLVTYCEAEFIEVGDPNTNTRTTTINSILYTPFNLKFATKTYGVDIDDPASRGNRIYIPYCFAAIHTYNADTGYPKYKRMSLRVKGKFIGKVVPIDYDYSEPVKFVTNNSEALFNIDMTLDSYDFQPHGMLYLGGHKVWDSIPMGINYQLNGNIGSPVYFAERDDYNTVTKAPPAIITNIENHHLMRIPTEINNDNGYFTTFTGPRNDGISGEQIYYIYLIPYYTFDPLYNDH